MEGKFCREKEDLQRQVFKGARSCHTSRKRRNTQRAEEAAFICNKRVGNKTYSRDTGRKEGLEEEEVSAPFLWEVKKVQEHTWRSAVKDRTLKPTPPSNPMVHKD